MTMRRSLGALVLFAALAGASAQAQAPAAYCGPKLYATYPLPRPFGPAYGTASCRAYVIEAPAANLNLALALNDADRARGLMDVHELPAFAGMLFAFPGDDQTRSFWMKDTLVPLDMVFVHGDGKVGAIFPNVPSSTYDTPDDKVATRAATAKYVIELRAGDAKRAGLRVGQHLDLPPIPTPVT
jgi:uncharacterized membrane protein (UPF0127 family)